MKTLRERVEEVFKEIRLALSADGGDAEIVEVTDDGVVKIKLKGACSGCPMAFLTISMGIERILKERIPEVKSVEAM